MKNKKGFTLIELMAVIILLGLIIMIIVPKITDSIENSKKNAAIDSALGYVKSARDYYNVNVLEKDYVIKEGINWIQDINSVIEVDGELPSSGYFYLENGKIEFAEFCVNKYYVIYEKSAATAVKTPDCLVDEVSEDFNPTSKYVSYVEGAKKVDIYYSEDPFDEYDGLAIGIYQDKNGDILNVFLGYYVDSLDESRVNYVNDYAGEEAMSYAPLSYTKDHFYIGEIASYIFLFDNNEYADESGYDEIINYNGLGLDALIEIFSDRYDDLNYIETLEF